MAYQDSDQQPNAEPRYQQVHQSLEQDIILGNVPLGSQLPSVQELCQRFDTSRITINRALSDLERDGYINRQRGKPATVVRTQPLPAPSTLDPFHASADSASEMRWRLSSLQYTEATPAHAEILGLQDQDLIWVVKRTGITQGEVAAHSTHCLKLPPDQDIVPRDVDPQQTVLAIFQAKGIPLSHSELAVTAIAAGREEARLLNVDQGEPLLKLDGVTYAQEASPFPVAVLHQIHVGRLTSWSMRVTPPPEHQRP
jgi:GntR family transcriptional regulator